MATLPVVRDRDAERADFEKHVSHVLAMAVQAQQAHKDTGAETGKFPCMKCGAAFHWARARNGHFRGCCSTEGCASFIQ